jgi:membrane protein DedA with SNARE-associated domain
MTGGEPAILTWFMDLAARLSADPVLQGTLAALSTFILEDPTTIGCGLLVADGRMALTTAFIGVSAGIAVGDIGLYTIGRVLGPRFAHLELVRRGNLDRTSEWLRRNVVAAVLLSRFIPGTRLVTYLAAGAIRASAYQFVLVVVFASIVWTALLLLATVSLGEVLLPALGPARWPVAIAAIAVFIIVQKRAAKKLSANEDRQRPKVSMFEFWPPWLFYAPVVAYCLWLGLRYRNLMLPTAVNPSIYSGGLIGESKSRILDLVSGDERRWIAPYIVCPVPEETPDDELVAQIERDLGAAGLAFPIVAKPDIGQRGNGVRPLYTAEDLARYLSEFPRGPRVQFQKLIIEDVGQPVSAETDTDRFAGIREAGVFYWRMPGSPGGSIFSITLKAMPSIRGDGKRTIRELIGNDPVARRAPRLYIRSHADVADRVLPNGEVYPLVFAGNHCRGAVFYDGTHLATPELLARCDALAGAIPEFQFGRFDVRFRDLDGFLKGEDFHIIEINGAGSEATHIWDSSTRISDAYGTLFEQFRLLFAIGEANRIRGHKPLGLLQFLRDAVHYWKIASRYPPSQEPAPAPAVRMRGYERPLDSPEPE